MPTGQDIVNAALTHLGMREQGGTASTSDSVDALSNLNAMWDAWGIDEGLIYAAKPVPVALAAATASYTLTPPTPKRVYRAFFLSGGSRYELDVVPMERYYSHNDLGATAVALEEVYIDFAVDSATGDIKMYTWPVISVNGTSVELESAVPFVAWDLVTEVNLPGGYQDPMQWALAFRLLASFGAAVAPEIAAIVQEMGAKAEARIRAMNARNRQMPQGAEMAPGAQQQTQQQTPGRA